MLRTCVRSRWLSLYAHTQRKTGYDALCAAVWGADYYGYENSLGVHIRHLREKLEAEPGAPQFLRTVRGIGYKLTKGEEA